MATYIFMTLYLILSIVILVVFFNMANKINKMSSTMEEINDKLSYKELSNTSAGAKSSRATNQTSVDDKEVFDELFSKMNKK